MKTKREHIQAKRDLDLVLEELLQQRLVAYNINFESDPDYTGMDNMEFARKTIEHVIRNMAHGR